MTKIEVQEMKRRIVYQGTDLADVNPLASVSEVVQIHAMTTPELATATVEGPEIKEGEYVYTVHKRLGTKG